MSTGTILCWISGAMVVGALTLQRCQQPVPSPKPPPAPDAADVSAPPVPPALSDASTDCVSACAALVRIGCSEGTGACPATMQRMQDDRIVADRVTHQAVTCVSVASWRTKDDVQTHTNWSCGPLSGDAAAGK
jgi:hypothetical protein